MGLSLGSPTYRIKYLHFTYLPYWDGDGLRHWEIVGLSQETLNSPGRKRLPPVSWGHEDSERERGGAAGILGPLNYFTKVMDLHIRGTSGCPSPWWDSVATGLSSCHSMPLLRHPVLSGPSRQQHSPLQTKSNSKCLMLRVHSELLRP